MPSYILGREAWPFSSCNYDCNCKNCVQNSLFLIETGNIDVIYRLSPSLLRVIAEELSQQNIQLRNELKTLKAKKEEKVDSKEESRFLRIEID